MGADAISVLAEKAVPMADATAADVDPMIEAAKAADKPFCLLIKESTGSSGT